MPLPLYGFLKGDTMGLVIVGNEQHTVAQLAKQLQQAANVRVSATEQVRVIYKGKALELGLTLTQAGLEPLERFDVIPETAHAI